MNNMENNITALQWFFDRLKDHKIQEQYLAEYAEAYKMETKQRTEDYKLGYRHGAGETLLTNMVLNKNK